jgi:hypothetical protein
MKLWQQVDWNHRLERSSVTTFARTFRVKLGKLNVLDGIAPTLCRSRYWIGFDPNCTVYSEVKELVDHLVETYGLEMVMKNGVLHKTAGQRSWVLPKDPQQGAKAMAALKEAEPMLEPRPFVKNGSSDTLGWAVFSSSDWAELEAADLYATRALFPLKGVVPEAAVPEAEATQRQRTPEHEELLAWVSANNAEMAPQLVEALEKLETSHPDSTEERDATSQIYRISRRARR